MTLASDMLADLNDRINDVANTQIPEANKLRYLNSGIRAMWPKIYRTVQDSTLVLTVDQTEYVAPPAFNYGYLVRVDFEHGVGTNDYLILDNFEVNNLGTSKIIRVKWRPGEYGAKFRLTGVVPVTEFATTSSTYDGPPQTVELPVWYATGLAASRRMDDRMDYKRYSTTTAQNGVDLREITDGSLFAFQQFELLLDRLQMTLPAGLG